MRSRFTLSPVAYRRIAYVALATLILIVLSGAAVRLTGSGLGCPDWPRCHGNLVAPVEYHSLIEWGNRVLSGLVTVACIAAGGLAWLRRPFRRDLALIGLLLPLGVVGQAALGALTVKFHLLPGFVMSHYLLSMLLIAAGVALAWRATFEPGERPPARDRLTTWAVRGLLVLGGVAVFAGTAATAAGPHPGDFSRGVQRLDFLGADTMDWAIHWHGRLGTALGIATLAVLALAWRRGADRRLLRALLGVAGLIAVQGAVGLTQYALHLPAALVWVHVSLASVLWAVLVLATAAAGSLAATPAGAGAPRESGPGSPVPAEPSARDAPAGAVGRVAAER